jgi:molybdopterin/thiamine biosynthesis adenylyltransferase
MVSPRSDAKIPRSSRGFLILQTTENKLRMARTAIIGIIPEAFALFGL